MGTKPVAGGWNRIVIETDDLDATLVALRGQGSVRVTNRKPGGRQVLIEDPSGNPVELFEANTGI